jgi:hypothetical protein
MIHLGGTAEVLDYQKTHLVQLNLMDLIIYQNQNLRKWFLSWKMYLVNKISLKITIQGNNLIKIRDLGRNHSTVKIRKEYHLRSAMMEWPKNHLIQLRILWNNHQSPWKGEPVVRSISHQKKWIQIHLI